RSPAAHVVFELVVAQLVQALDDARGGEPRLDDRARAARGVGQLGIVTVDGLPVVRRVDQNLAGEQLGRQLAEAVRRDGQHDDVGVAYDLLGRGRACAGRQYVDGQGDVLGRSGSGDRDVVAGREGDPGQAGAE